jgi:hypothetical protein
MDRIPMPAALLACRLLGSLGCQKQVGIGHRGHCAKNPMKPFLTLFAFMAVTIVAFTVIGCRDVDTSKADFSKDVSIHSGDTVLPLMPNDPVATDIARWIRGPEREWKRTYTTYAPKLVIRNAHFTLNLLGEVAVLNYKPDPTKEKWIQVEREYEAKDIPSLEGLLARIKEAQQGGTGQPATRPESDSEGGDKPQPEAEGRTR